MKRLALLLALLPTLAGAQTMPCASHETWATGLAERFGETPQVMGLTRQGQVMELYANPETGTWTALISRPDGPTCMAAEGTGWEPVAPAPNGDPA